MYDPPKVFLIMPIPAASVGNFESQLGLIKVQAFLKVIHNEKGSNAVQR